MSMSCSEEKDFFRLRQLVERLLGEIQQEKKARETLEQELKDLREACQAHWNKTQSL